MGAVESSRVAGFSISIGCLLEDGSLTSQKMRLLEGELACASVVSPCFVPNRFT